MNLGEIIITIIINCDYMNPFVIDECMYDKHKIWNHQFGVTTPVDEIVDLENVREVSVLFVFIYLRVSA